MSALEIRGICLAGGGVVVNSNDYSSLELRSIASVAKNHGCKVIIKNASVIDSLSCRGIALAGGEGTVIFDFAE